MQTETPKEESSPKGEQEKYSHVGCSHSFLREESKLGVGNEVSFPQAPERMLASTYFTGSALSMTTQLDS